MRKIIWMELVVLLFLIVFGVMFMTGQDNLQTQNQQIILETVESSVGKNQIVAAFAETNDLQYSQYPESLIQLLERNPEAENFVLAYPLEYGKDHFVDMTQYGQSESVPLFLQWDTRWGYLDYGDDVAGITGCGPVCLSMAGYYVTKDAEMSPDRIIQFALDNGYYVPGVGSSWTLISEGGELLGLDVTEIPLDQERILNNLDVDNPIICAMGPGDFTSSGHFVVMTGHEDGKIRINDPNSLYNSQVLWEYERIESQIENLWVIRKGW